jgi:hypothetical protein
LYAVEGYIGSGDSFVYTFNPTVSGTVSQLTTNIHGAVTGIAFYNNVGYASEDDGYIYTFNPLISGTTSRWTTNTPGAQAEGVAFFGNTGYLTSALHGFVYTFNPLVSGTVAQLTTTAPPFVAPSGVGGLTFYNDLGWLAGSDAIYTFDPIVSGSITQWTATLSGGVHANDVAFLGTTGYLAASDGLVYTFSSTVSGGVATPLTTATVSGEGQAECLAFYNNIGYFGADDGFIYTFSPFVSGSITQWTTDNPASDEAFAIAFFTPTPAPSPTHAISLKGLHRQVLTVATHFNQAASAAVLDLFSGLTGGALIQAIESACPARLACPVFAADNALFGVSGVVEKHVRNHHFARSRMAGSPRLSSQLADSKLADASLLSLKTSKKNPIACEQESLYSVWIEGLGLFTHEHAQDQIAAFKTTTGGVVAGIEGYGTRSNLIGGGLAYTYTNLKLEEGMGHAAVNQEYAVLYASFQPSSQFYADVAIWGGLYQVNNTRRISMPGFHGTAESHPKGWQLSPHLELGYDFPGCVFSVEPFAMFDWVNNWERQFSEHGAGILDMKQKRQYSSLLRSEVGLRFYQSAQFCWGQLVVQEKASYVNKALFHVGTVTAFLIGAPGSFTVETLTRNQNLAVVEMELLFEPVNKKRPYGSVSYQGEFFSGYVSNQVMLEIGKSF